jgi:hypothetical protein
MRLFFIVFVGCILSGLLSSVATINVLEKKWVAVCKDADAETETTTCGDAWRAILRKDQGHE